MKINISKLASGLSMASLLAPVFAFAQISGQTAPTITNIFGAGGLICTIINFLFTILVILAIFFVLFAAFKYLTAGGDEAKVKEATNMLLYAAVAIGVGLLAKGFPIIIGSIIPGGTIAGTC